MTAKEPSTVTTPQQYQAPSAEDFLMGGGGAPSAKFSQPGTTVAGRITEKPRLEQQRDFTTGEAKFWKDGNPQMQLVVTVQTDLRDPQIDEDDGRRRLYVKGALKNAVADAVRAAGARGLEVGGLLSVTYTHDGQATQRGMNPPKQYTAQYTAAVQAELTAPDPGVPAGVNPHTGEITTPAVPAQAAPAGVPGLTPDQLAAIQNDPAKAALFAQLAGQSAAPAQNAPAEPPF